VADAWLERWLPLVAERAGGLPILELGCGSGQDSEVLATAGHRVVGIDLSEKRIEGARKRVPSAEFHRRDLLNPFPVEKANVVLASLSLHYFPWDVTLRLAKRIHAVLGPGGVLLCRLNSTNDHHHGASGHPEIAPNYYSVEGENKRFFDRDAVQAMFASGWRSLHLEEIEVHRYAQPKWLWETILEKAG
jgi:SAM-dependent methyltransferase